MIVNEGLELDPEPISSVGEVSVPNVCFAVVGGTADHPHIDHVSP